MNRSKSVLSAPARSCAWSSIVPQATVSSCSVALLAAMGLLSAGPVVMAQTTGALPAGTLPVLRSVVAGRATVTSTVPGVAAPRLTVDQASRRAIVDWKSFNIGRSAEVQFKHQQGSNAVTLNRIYDANPSVIQGRLTTEGPTVNNKVTAGGQVILINQNGILFDRGAQVNTQALLASTLNLTMSNSQFCAGDLVACNSGAALTSGGLTTPAFSGGYDDEGNPLPTRPGAARAGTISIGSFGPADAAAPVITSGVSGSIVLIASRIDHDGGVIASPDGQVVLAAGRKAYLAVNEDSSDITLRGFRVEIEAETEGPGLDLTNLVRNGGEITADRGNVTIAALAINQAGRISAKTAVQRNGSIYLTARSKDGAESGSVNFAQGSVTEVVPDAADTATVPDSTSYAPYRGVIRAQGGLIENHGTVQARGGRIGFEADNTADPGAARVYLAEGSLTSVAGAWADVDTAKNLVTVPVTSNELKNSPDQKGGFLFGKTVTVDLRDGNNLLALDAYRGAVARTVTEKAAVGGELSIGSTGSVIQRRGAAIDASGGGYRYSGGRVATTKLLGEDGRVYDIATAPQQRKYVAQLDRYQRTYERWGQTTNTVDLTGSFGTFQPGYAEGLAGGSVRIGSGAGLVLDGTLNGGVTIGERQFARAPRGATLLVGTGFQPLSLARIDRPVTAVYNNESQRIGNVTWRQQATDTLGADFGVNSVLSQSQRENVTLAATQIFGAAAQTAEGRVESGFGTVEVNSDGLVTVPEDVSIRSDIGASLTLRGPLLDVAGDIRLPSGTLTLAPQLLQAETFSDEQLTQSQRTIVRDTSTLSVAGAWINQSGTGGVAVGEQLPTGRISSGTVVSATNGGSLLLRVTDPEFQTVLERGSVLDVSGGAQIDSSKRITGGRGGQLTVGTGIGNPQQQSSDWMQAELRGHALNSGGSLTLNLNRAEIAAPDANGVLPATTNRLSSDLFSESGFASISVVAPNGITVADGTQVDVRQANLVVDSVAALALPSGGDLRSVSAVQDLPSYQRASAALTLTADAGAVTVGEGARLATDAGGSLTLTAASALDIDGQLLAPGGRITLLLRGSNLLDASPLHLGAQSVVSAAGTFVQTPSDVGLVRGSVLGGGTVTLEARQAGIVADAGSLIDVSGLERRIDFLSDSNDGAVQQQTVAGHAGTVVLKAQRGVQLNGTLAASGTATAAGGSLAMELTQVDRQPGVTPEQRLVISAVGGDQAPVGGATTSVLSSRSLQAAGFSKLRLLSEDRIEFQGTTTLDFERGIRLDAPIIDLREGAVATLRGSTVSIGQSLGRRVQQPDDSGQLVSVRDDSLAQPSRTPVAGTGVFNVDAGMVDIYGSLVVQGTASTRIQSDTDVRFIAREVNLNQGQGNDANLVFQNGSLDVAGNLEFSASQLYPATRSRFAVQAHGSDARLAVEGNGNAPGDVYSVAGQLTLEAPVLVQGGTVRAPQGELNLVASQTLELKPGSLTSVSGGDLTVLYGTTLDGVQWQYIDGGLTSSTSNPRLLDAVSPQGKRLTLSAPSVVAEKGATVDLQGGGNVLAAEFVPGNGGDTDVTTAANTFAIIPKSRLAAMPYDTYLQFVPGASDTGAGFSLGNGRDTALYDSVQIAAGSRVPAGEYVLLPARFALLADAFLVQLQTGSSFRNLQAGQTTALPNGEVVVAGHRSARGTSVRESQSVGVVVLPGSAVNRYSDFTLSSAQFFVDQAGQAGRLVPLSPWDAGSMGILNASALSLGASFLTAGQSDSSHAGRSAEIDISGPRIAIVDKVGSTALPAGTLEIDSATLSGLKASVLIGGTRSRVEDGVRITTSAEQVSIANTAQSPVELPELLITASGGIDAAAGSVLRATGKATGTESTALFTEESGALVRLSSGAQATVSRGSNARSASGEVDIAAGAVLQASGSLLLDATNSTRSAGQLLAGGPTGSGGAISLSSVNVSLGQTNGVSASLLGGLVLSNEDLLSYGELTELTLRAYDRIDFFGQANVGSAALDRLVIDAPQLSAQPVGDVSKAVVSAGELQWVNRSGSSGAAAGGSGDLRLSAQRLVVGEGTKSTAGFESIRLVGTESIEVQGKGALSAGGGLTLETPLLRAQGGSDQRIAAVNNSAADPVYGDLNLVNASSQGASARAATALGGRISLEGQNVVIDTTVQARSGRIAVTAHEGDLRLTSTSRLDAAGETRSFNGSVVAADGGTVALTAADGALTMASGSRVDVAAAARGGNAGHWQLRAQDAALEGAVLGTAGSSARGGSADIDLGTLTDFSGLNTLLNAGGFNEERRVRVRQGDVIVASSDSVSARRVTLSADEGRMGVFGTIGRTTAQGGGRIGLHADDGLELAAGSRLIANATGVGARGGEVRVDTRTGTLDFDSSAVIDVRAGDAGPAGSVIFGVTRDAGGVMGDHRLAGQVLRYSAAGLAARQQGINGDAPASVDLEATRVYSGADVPASLDGSLLEGWAAEHQTFVNAVSASTSMASLRDDAGALTGARVLGATEVRSDGALSIDSNWDLTSSAWRAGNLPGTLTVRAAGDLTIQQTIGAPGLPSSGNAVTNNANNNVNHAIVDGDTWNIRLVAGADLNAADALATGRDTAAGSLLLSGAAANVRTGTGRIDVAAAGDIRFDNVASSIYTAGRIGTADTAQNGNNRWAVDGGSITLVAGGSVGGVADVPDLWVTDWLRRWRQTPTAFVSSGYLTEWWSYRPRFQQGVGALAGGDIEVQAGADVTDLMFASPTSGRIDNSSGQRSLDVVGGGDLVVRASGNVDGTAFLVGRGVGSVAAGGDIGRTNATQAYLMGISSGAVPEQAQLSLTAGGELVMSSAVNPTYLGINGGTGAAGPSFNATNPAAVSASSTATTFFTYSSNSALSLVSKSGDVGVAGGLAPAENWRSITSFSANNLPSLGATAYPASLALVALDGDVNGPGSFERSSSDPNAIKTYPSERASVVALASGSIRNLGVEVSDLSPSSLVTPLQNFQSSRPAQVGADFFSSGSRVSAVAKPISAGRITERIDGLPFGLVEREPTASGLQFDVQALNGSVVVDDGASQLYLPARSRILAGQDILDVDLQLQNLHDSDLSVVRAVNGDIIKRSGSGGFEIRGPGQLLFQAGGDIDLGAAVVAVNGEIAGGLVASGDTRNPLLSTSRSARVTLIAGVSADVDLTRMDATYLRILEVNRLNAEISSLFAQLDLEVETGRDVVLGADTIESLIPRNAAFSRFAALDKSAPEALAAYQKVLRTGSLPQAGSADAGAAQRLLTLLSREDDVARLASAGSVRKLLSDTGTAGSPVTLGGEALDASTIAELSALGDLYPKLYAGAVNRRLNGAQLLKTTPLVFDDMLATVVGNFIPATSAGGGNISTFQTSIQTLGGSDIDMWAPAGNAVVGLTTPSSDRPVGILTNAGGGIRSVLSGDFNINQGKVLTAQGGDILLFSALGSIDAGRGAKTSLSTPAPQRKPILDAEGNQIGVQVVIPASATGSGIQTLTSDPDGLGPAVAPPSGDIYLFAPAGKIDAGEAGVRSSGNLLVNASVVVAGAGGFESAGASVGVPVAVGGSVAASLASAGGTTNTSKAAEDAATAAGNAARAAAASAEGLQKPTILTVEVMGFGEKNCKEQQKDCFAK